MIDIIDALNEKARLADLIEFYSWRDVMMAAAEEIERLRQQLDAANAAHDFVCELAADKLKELGI